MSAKFTGPLCCLIGLSAGSLLAAEPASIVDDIGTALSTDEAASAKAVARLRAAGRPAFDEVLARRDLAEVNEEADAGRFDALVDAVGGARYCSVSRLYWHTDHDAALAEARRTGKPVLALRMMGYLTDEFSCANSRFFRTTLYSNEEIGKLLRENFVLTWKSVRPVPKVVVDFGDGRKLERTLTGNSIHYVLAPDGTVIDGLPGLHSPRKFEQWISTVGSYAKVYHQANEENRASFRVALKGHHEREISRLLRAWKADLDRIDAAAELAKLTNAAGEAGARVAAPPARTAAVLARPKALVELPLIADVMGETQKLNERTDEAMWDELAALHADEVDLDPASIAVIQRENPALAANAIAPTKFKVENPLLRMLAKLQRSIAVDTVRNEYELHRRLHQWFADGSAPADVDELNEKVYAELFLTPRSDPWLGLVAPDVYTGLENGGIVNRE